MLLIVVALLYCVPFFNSIIGSHVYFSILVYMLLIVVALLYCVPFFTVLLVVIFLFNQVYINVDYELLIVVVV